MTERQACSYPHVVHTLRPLLPTSDLHNDGMHPQSNGCIAVDDPEDNEPITISAALAEVLADLIAKAK